MPYYLVQGAYTPETWAAQMKNPQDRTAQLRPMIERLGGKLESFFYAFGESDFVLIAQAPDNATAAATAIAAFGSGSLRFIRTTPLMTVEEGLEAMRKSGAMGFRPAGS